MLTALVVIAALALIVFGTHVYLTHRPHPEDAIIGSLVQAAAPPAPAPVVVNIHPPMPAAPVEPRIPTPVSADWPAGTKLVNNVDLPGSPPGEAAWGFEYAKTRYVNYPLTADFVTQLARKGIAWFEADDPRATDGRGPYRVR